MVEWTLFLGLGGLAVFFLIWGEVLQKFLSQNSSFMQYERPLEVHPTITICFPPVVSDTSIALFNYDYGKDYKISYKQYDYEKEFILYEGENFNSEANETILFEEVHSIKMGTGKCFKVSPINVSLTKSTIRQIKVFYADDVPYGKIPSLRFYFTSEENAYGIIQNVWIDGDVLIIDLEKSVSLKRIELKSQNYIYLKRKKKLECSPTNSFYECFGSLILKDEFQSCPKKCLTMKMPKGLRNKNVTIPKCQTEAERKCADNVIWNLYTHNVSKLGICPKLCTSLQFSGKSVLEYPAMPGNKNYTISYNFAQPEVINVFEEYLVYDAVGLIGAVGGTLGIFIGFSFTNVISFIINFGRCWNRSTPNKTVKV